MVSLDQKNLGQYFTVSENLQKFVFEKVKNKGGLLLEPSFGAGHLLRFFKDSDSNYPIFCYEIDYTIKPIFSFNEHQTVVYGDFTKQIITKKFKTIVANPPYIKQSSGNLYIKFMEICFAALDADGEMIFIVPSDFIKLTSAAALITSMIAAGSFTDFLFPHDEKLFDGASVDVLVFRYEKGLHTKSVVVNDKKMICNVNNGIITFSETEIIGKPISDTFNVFVGLVSGKDSVYRSDLGNIHILSDKGRLQKFIFARAFPTGNVVIDTHLRANKPALLERKIRKFTDDNWFEWGAPRNIKSIESNLGNPCIYVRNLTRNKEVAFLGTVQYFGGALICLIPKVGVSELELKNIIEYMNSETFQKDYLYSKRFKIGHKQLCNAILPRK